MRDVDAITLAVTQNRLDHITHQMGWVMTRTARSPIASQSHDFSCFLAAADGSIIAQADGIPIHTGGAGFAVDALLREMESAIRIDDVYLLNDPYVAGGNHLPDWVILRPTFCDETLCGFACIRAHQADIGGGAAGTYNPAATEIFQEGLRLPVLKLIDAGALREDLWNLLLINTRSPAALDGDLRAMIGSTKIGADGLASVVNEFGLTGAQKIFEGILDHADRCQRAALSKLPPGVYHGEDLSDNDCFSEREVRIKVELTISPDGNATVDFTGSDPQILGFKNSSLANTYAATFVAITAFLDPGIPRNAGRLRSIRIIAPEGSIVNPHPPAPVTMCTVFPAHEIIHAIWKALADAAPALACAGWAKNIFGVTASETDNGPFVLYHVHASAGGGAVDGRDGFNSISHVCTLGGFVQPNIEMSELQYPVVYGKQEFRRDSAGAGKFRGGTGVEYEVDIQVPATYSFRGEGLGYVSSFGVIDGSAGEPGEMTIQEVSGPLLQTPKFAVRRFGPARLRALSPGGGGYGHPLERDPEAVLRDVRDEVVGEEMAREIYGVVFEDGLSRVDQAATNDLRAELRSASSR